ncbi:MAG: HlyD family efflux transporter periplasmic adaptor subunit [Xanthobacteraceae bacterium]
MAFVLIALSLWAFLPNIGYRIASSAFVNAELVRVAAPIAGRLTQDLPRKGDYIERPKDVTLVQALSRDQRHLLDLIGQYAIANGRAETANKQLTEIAAEDDELAKRMKVYRDGMIVRLGHERDEARAEKIGCLAEVEQRRDVGSRMGQLVRSGLATPIRTSEALASQEAASTRCEMADARLQRLQAEIVSAQDGIFLRDGANDVPYSQQQRDRLALRRQDLETKASEESLKASQIAPEIVEERERLDRLSHFDLSLPAQHVVWSVAASPGSTVSEGQILFDLAACAERFIVVELPGRDFEKIKAGVPAFVRLIGSEDWKQGEVRQVRGSAARVDDRLLAAQIPKPNPNSITVEVALPHSDAETSRNNFCNVGRLAEVQFERSGFAFVDDVGRKFRDLAGYFKHSKSVDHVENN